MNRFDCYELCVQSPADLVPFLRAVHGSRPVTLREDFCGTAALSRHWPGHAIAIDSDAAVIAEARRRDAAPNVDLRCADCITSADEDASDIIFVGNFSIGYIQDHRTLVNYLASSRSRLRSGGVFICDTYGGASAFKTGSVERTHAAPDGSVVKYLWRQDSADPLTGRVRTSLHFRVIRDGEVIADHPDAFTYDWRLWSIAELREAMTEAGFAASEVYARIDLMPDGRPHAVGDPAELGETWFVCVAGRV
jgi:SAM-dependent methyltransferase